MPNEYGDYQTPLSLSNKVTKLMNNNNVQYTNIIEPTFGNGSFIISALKNMKYIKSIRGFEINKGHYLKAINNVKNIAPKHIKIDLKCRNIFKVNINSLFSPKEHNLIIGNLPWVTVSHLSYINSNNVPRKSNIKGLSGFDALTGKSNFDVSEYISLMLMNRLNRLPLTSTIAILVKDTVSQNILKYLPESNLNPSSFNIYEFNAKKIFNVNVNACLMVVSFGKKNKFHNIASVYDLSHPTELRYKFGWVNNKFTSNVNNYKKYCRFDKKSHWNWRSGVKHDASKVMNLIVKNGRLINGLHEPLSLESNLIYPLVKSSDIRKDKIHQSYNKYIIITQRKIGQSTNYIKNEYPKTWRYLKQHIKFFLRRKSSIYKHTDAFSIFGIGSYSFKPYKVAVSGMYKKPFFSILAPYNDKPAMTDDTIYFVGFDVFQDAVIFAAIMNSTIVQDLLNSLVFNSSKRPYTKSVLKRINALSVLNHLSLKELNKYAFRKITESDVIHFKSKFLEYSAISLF